LAQPDLRSAMGNSPSSGLGGGSTHSSRDVRMTNPEKEVERPSASRAPTHNEYTELPASSKPHNGARTRGSNEVRKEVPVPNSQAIANSNAVPDPVYEEVQVPTCSSSTSIQRGAWKSENSLYDRPSPPSNSPGVRPAVRPEVPAAPEAIRPGMPTAVRPEVHPELPPEVRRRSRGPVRLEVHSELRPEIPPGFRPEVHPGPRPEVRRRSDGEVRPVELEPNHVIEQAVRKVRPGDAYTNSPEVRPSRSYPNYVNGFAPTTGDSREQALREVRPDDVSHYSYGVRPEHIHTNRSDDLYPALDDSQAQLIVRGVRPDDFSHYSYGVRPESIHTNYMNCPAHAESNESFCHWSQEASRWKIHSSLERTVRSCSEPRRTDSHVVGPDTRPVHPGRIRLPYRMKNFKLPQGTADVKFQ